MTPLLSANHLTFSYTDRPVLDDVSFEIDRASIVAVIGPNGSGKTTLLKILNATLEPAAG